MERRNRKKGNGSNNWSSEWDRGQTMESNEQKEWLKQIHLQRTNAQNIENSTISASSSSSSTTFDVSDVCAFEEMNMAKKQ